MTSCLPSRKGVQPMRQIHPGFKPEISIQPEFFPSQKRAYVICSRSTSSSSAKSGTSVSASTLLIITFLYHRPAMRYVRRSAWSAFRLAFMWAVCIGGSQLCSCFLLRGMFTSRHSAKSHKSSNNYRTQMESGC